MGGKCGTELRRVLPSGSPLVMELVKTAINIWLEILEGSGNVKI